MHNLVVVAQNEEACKLLDCLVAYRKIIDGKENQTSEQEDYSDITVVPAVEISTPKPKLIRT